MNIDIYDMLRVSQELTNSLTTQAAYISAVIKSREINDSETLTIRTEHDSADIYSGEMNDSEALTIRTEHDRADIYSR